MYNWSGRSNKEREVLFIHRLLGRGTSTDSLAQYGEFIPVEGRDLIPDSDVLFYKDIVESVEVTATVSDRPDITDTKVIDFVQENSEGNIVKELVEYYAAGLDNFTYVDITDINWSTNPINITLDPTHRYLWNKTVITLSNGFSDASYKLIASYLGDSGIQVSNLTEYYAIYPYNTSAPSEVYGKEIGQWSTTKPIERTIDNRYIWNFNDIVFKNGSTQGGYNNAMIIGDYGNQLREVKFNDYNALADPPDYKIEGGTIYADESWWQGRSSLGIEVDWQHVADITQIQINDVIIIRGMAYVSDGSSSSDPTYYNCPVLINSKVTQISNKDSDNEYTIRATTLNYVLDESGVASAAMFATLTNDSSLVPCDYDGSNPDLSQAKTAIEMYVGGIKQELAQNSCSYEVTPSGAVTCSIVNTVGQTDPIGTLTVTQWNTSNVDSVSITITVLFNEKYYSKVFSVTKQKQGEKGDTGDSGFNWTFSINTYEYIRDIRHPNDSMRISITPEISGYPWIPQIIASTDRPDEQLPITSNSLTIPYNNNYDFISITMTPVSTVRTDNLSGGITSTIDWYTWLRVRPDLGEYKFKYESPYWVFSKYDEDSGQWVVIDNQVSNLASYGISLNIPSGESVVSDDNILITTSVLESPEPYTSNLLVNDITEYGHYYGIQSDAPTDNSEPPILYVPGKPTDYFTSRNDGNVYEYLGSTPWSLCNDINRVIQGLNDLLARGISLSSFNDPNTVSFFNRIITNELFVNKLKAVEALFENIDVIGNSSLQGEVTNPVFQTLSKNVVANTYSTNIGTTSTGKANGNTVSANGIYGYELIKYLRGLTLYSGSTPSPIPGNDLTQNDDYDTLNLVTTSSDSQLFGFSDFNRLFKVTAITSSLTTLKSVTGSSYDTPSTLTWVNNFPKTVSVQLNYSAKSVTYESTVTSYYWDFIYSSRLTSKSRPSTYGGNYKPESWLDESDVGSYYTYNYDITGPDSGGNYYWTEDTYKCESNEESSTTTSRGTVTITNAGTTINKNSGSYVDVTPGSTLKIVLGAASSVESTVASDGSASFKWRSSDNFSTGLYFVYWDNGYGSIKHYVIPRLTTLSSDFSTGVDTHSNILKTGTSPNEVTWLNLPVNDPNPWSYQNVGSGYDLYKLVRFDWNNPSQKPDSTIKATKFSIDTSVWNWVDYTGANISIPSEINSVQLTPTSLSFYTSSNTLGLDNSSTYVRRFSVSILVTTKDLGVYSWNLLPKTEPSQYRPYISAKTGSFSTSLNELEWDYTTYPITSLNDTYLFSYNGGWMYNGSSIDTIPGVTITGTPVFGNTITVSVGPSTIGNIITPWGEAYIDTVHSNKVWGAVFN